MRMQENAAFFTFVLGGQGMIVQHNLESIYASNQYKKTMGIKDKSMKRLSSGYRINSAADDAAGLQISQKMRSQIRGLDQTIENIEDGINLVRIGDGGMSEIQAMLHRMRELSVQAANDINMTVDRETIQQEIDDLTEQVNNIALSTNFNGIYMLNGGTNGTGSGGSGGTGPIVSGGVAEALSKRTTYGGSANDTMKSALMQGDSVIFCGNTSSSDQDLDGLQADTKTDGWVTKVDSDGEVVWTTKVGVNGKNESFNSITATKDGGYLAGGEQDGNVYMAKLDSNGNVEWTYTIPSPAADNINGVELMQDGSGNVFISLQTFSGNDIKDGNGNPLGGSDLGGRDTIIMVVDPSVNPNTDYNNFEVKAYRVGGGSNEQISKIYPTSDGGYIGGNYTTSGTIHQSSASGGTATPPQTTIGNGHHHAYIVKFDSNGDTERVLKFGDNTTPGQGGNSGEGISRIIETKDGGFIVVGNAEITDTVGNAAPNTDHSNKRNIWVMKLDKNLNPEWSRTYGSSDEDYGQCILETDKGYVVSGSVGTIDGDVSPKNGYSGQSAWVFMIDKTNGDIIWDEVHGGSGGDNFTAMYETDGGDILLGGNSSSNDADLDGKNKGGSDAWFLRISGSSGESLDTPTGSGGSSNRDKGGSIMLQVGANYMQDYEIERADMRAKTLFGDPIVLDMSSHKTANEAIGKIDKAVDYVSSKRGKYGAYENTLSYRSAANAITSENTSHAESVKSDTDMAKEMVMFSKSNILLQSTQSMLAQANSQKEGVLSLLQ